MLDPCTKTALKFDEFQPCDELLPQLPTRGRSSNAWKDLCSVSHAGVDMGECIVKASNSRNIKI